MGIKKWKAKEIFELRNLWLNGYTSAQLAEKFGVSRNSIIGKLNRLNLLNKGRLRKKNQQSVRKPIPVIKDAKVKFISITERLKEIKNPQRGIAIINANKNSCRFVISGIDGINTAICGEEISVGAFCDKHARMCYANYDELYAKGWRRIFY